MSKKIMALEEQTYFDNGVHVALYNPETNVENGLLDVQDQSHLLDAHTGELNEGMCTAQTLDTISACAQATLLDGGLSEPVAAALATAVEHLVSRLGSRRKVMPSMEAFTPRGRKQATVVAIESIKEMAVAVWQAIKKAFDKVIEWISSAFKALFGLEKIVKEKEKAVEKEAKEVKQAHSSSDLSKAEEIIKATFEETSKSNGPSFMDKLRAEKERRA